MVVEFLFYLLYLVMKKSIGSQEIISDICSLLRKFFEDDMPLAAVCNFSILHNLTYTTNQVDGV